MYERDYTDEGSAKVGIEIRSRGAKMRQKTDSWK